MDAEHHFSADVGAMAIKQQLDIVSRQVDDAVSKGAKVLIAGKARGDGLLPQHLARAQGSDAAWEALRPGNFAVELVRVQVQS